MKSDVQLHKEVVDAMAFDLQVDERDLTVGVHNGIVTLSGTVPSYAHKYAAERAVKRIAGVRGIAEEMRVELPQAHRRTDADIAAAAVNALAWNSFLPTHAIQVTVENGLMTLTGNVDLEFQRAEAETAVRNLMGVGGITNLIAMKTSSFVAPRDVKEKIEQEFERTAEIEAKRINVETVSGKVILKGVVHSLSERDEAARAAWHVPGVTKVENLLTVG
jgi:osmotically-inducible protein OsmY